MNIKIFLYALLLFATVFLPACEEDTVLPQAGAAFTASETTVMVGEEIQFENNSENATAFVWSFGDGTTSKQVSPKKSYASSGVFLVSLVATGPGGSQIFNSQITVVPSPSFSVEDEDNLKNFTPVHFVNMSKGATSYLWSFGDKNESESTEEDPYFTYNMPGTYTVTLTAISAEGERTITRTVTIGTAEPELYFLEDAFLKKVTLTGDEVTTLADISDRAGVGLAFNSNDSTIYFSDFTQGVIWHANMDGSNAQVIADGIVDPYGIALDIAGGKIYWVDDEGNVSRANLDGSQRQNGIVTIPDGQMRAIALDLEHQKMYFYEVNAENLYRANLDGSDATIVVSGAYGYGIAVDTVHDKIYYDDQNQGKLTMANLDGTGTEEISDIDSRIYGIVVDYDDDLLYWSERDNNEIYVSNLDGSDKKEVVSGVSDPRGIFIRK